MEIILVSPSGWDIEKKMDAILAVKSLQMLTEKRLANKNVFDPYICCANDIANQQYYHGIARIIRYEKYVWKELNNDITIRVKPGHMYEGWIQGRTQKSSLTEELLYKGYGKYYGPKLNTIVGWWRDYMDLNGQAVYNKYDTVKKTSKMFQKGTFDGTVTDTLKPK